MGRIRTGSDREKSVWPLTTSKPRFLGFLSFPELDAPATYIYGPLMSTIFVYGIVWCMIPSGAHPYSVSVHARPWFIRPIEDLAFITKYGLLTDLLPWKFVPCNLQPRWNILSLYRIGCILVAFKVWSLKSEGLVAKFAVGLIFSAEKGTFSARKYCRRAEKVQC